jgi:hypothetical protein
MVKEKDNVVFYFLVWLPLVTGAGLHSQDVIASKDLCKHRMKLLAMGKFKFIGDDQHTSPLTGQVCIVAGTMLVPERGEHRPSIATLSLQHAQQANDALLSFF